MSFRRNEFSALEEELRSRRPSLDQNVEDRLVADVTPRRRGGHRGFRTAVAVAGTVAMFGVLAAFGGVSYAFTSARTAVGPWSTEHSSSWSQYHEGDCHHSGGSYGDDWSKSGDEYGGNFFFFHHR
jgi:hypothetical protein